MCWDKQRYGERSQAGYSSAALRACDPVALDAAGITDCALDCITLGVMCTASRNGELSNSLPFGENTRERTTMKLNTLALATVIVALPAAALAQSSGNSASQSSPGHQMQDQGSKPGSPGASGYAPGQQMQDKGSVPGSSGASGYAPGQTKKDTDTTTGSGSTSRSGGSMSGSQGSTSSSSGMSK